jgi:predicted DNA-binding transcriptional regulator YafY
MFALDRIRDLELTDQTFAIPEDFSVQEYLGDSLHLERGEPVEVAIKFDSYQARWIRERVWHSSQSIEELPDGSLMLRMVVGSLGEVKRWAMSFGSRAEVLEPERLREEIRREIERVGEVYGWENGGS